MKHEQIIEELQNNGCALGRDIAKAVGIENSEAIRALLELEEQSRVVQKNGYWALPGFPLPTAKKSKRTGKKGS